MKKVIEMIMNIKMAGRWTIDGISLSCLVGRISLNLCIVIWQHSQHALCCLARLYLFYLHVVIY